MSAETLKVVGQFAGASGVILFLILFFFRDILTSKLAATISKTQAAHTINLMIIGVLIVAVIGCLAAVFAHSNSGCSTTTGNITVTQGQSDSSIVSPGCGNTTVRH
jgi:hypothetical protein